MTDSTLTAAEAAAVLFKQWIVLSSHVPAKSPIRSKDSFNGPVDRNLQLKNGRRRKFLHYENQVGFDIGWTDNAAPKTAIKSERWFFLPEAGDGKPILYGQPIAIGLGKNPSFMCHEKRFIGVDLQWHDQPCYEWLLLGGERDTPVKTNEWFAIYNTKVEECFIETERTMGGNVGYPSSQTWWDQGVGILKNLGKKAAEEAGKQAVKDFLK